MKEPVFFVANRGHHADIGGISPGINGSNERQYQFTLSIFLQKDFKIYINSAQEMSIDSVSRTLSADLNLTCAEVLF